MTDRRAASGTPGDGIPDASAAPPASRLAAPAGFDDATVVSDATALSHRPKPPAVVAAADDDLDRTHLADRTALVGRARRAPIAEPPSPRRAGAEPIPDAAPLRYAPRLLPPVGPSPSAPSNGRRSASSAGPAPDAAAAGARRRRARARVLTALVVGCAALVVAAGILIALLVNAF